MNATFYSARTRAGTKIYIALDQITHIRFVSDKSTDIETTTSIHRVKGEVKFVRSYIKYLAMRHTVPIRLKL